MPTSPPLFRAAVPDEIELRRRAVRRARDIIHAVPPDQVEQMLHIARVLTSAPIARLMPPVSIRMAWAMATSASGNQPPSNSLVEQPATSSASTANLS